MQQIQLIFNAISCGLIAATLIGAVMSRKVHDGVVVKSGLICMALGFGSIAMRMVAGIVDQADGLALARSLLLVNAGLAVVLIGYVWRNLRHPARRLEDWICRGRAES